MSWREERRERGGIRLNISFCRSRKRKLEKGRSRWKRKGDEEKAGENSKRI